MIELFYPASFLPHKNHSLLNYSLVREFLASHDVKIYLTITDHDMIFAAGNIVLLGRIPREECMQYLQRSSALLFLSSFESLGLPLIEAAEIAKPIICPDLIYARELLGDSAYYYQDQSSISLCNILTKFVRHKGHPISSSLTTTLKSVDFAWEQFINSVN